MTAPSQASLPTTRVHLISGPRNISTALMYAFRSRADTRVVDEPLYGHYLRVTGLPHPGREAVLASMDTDGARVVRDVILGPSDRPVLFVKDMAHHLVDVGLPLDWLPRVTNVFLTRDPAEMVPSLLAAYPDADLSSSGLPQQVRLLEALEAAGEDPPVLDARLVLEDPAGVLARLCERIGIGWDPAMLSWEPGPKPEDGVWAPHWYAQVHQSTGFEPYRPRPASDDPRVRAMVEALRPLYERLASRAIRP